MALAAAWAGCAEEEPVPVYLGPVDLDAGAVPVARPDASAPGWVVDADASDGADAAPTGDAAGE